MAPLLALALAALAAGSPCEEARRSYEALSLDEALAKADAALEGPAAGDMECLEVRALVLLVLGRFEDADGALVRIFERQPERPVRDPSLSPSLAAHIEAVRESSRPLSSTVTARWLVHQAIRVDVRLDGGLRDAAKVRYVTRLLPSGIEAPGEALLVGRAATATVSVGEGLEAVSMKIDGQVLGREDRVLHQFSSEVLLAGRPAAVEKVVEVDSGGTPWFVWLGIGLGAVGAAAVITILSLPGLPDAEGTLGRASVDR